jgi:phenylacetate-CoA ligase
MTTTQRLYDGAPAWLQNVMLNAYAARIEHHRYGPRYRAAVTLLREQERWPSERLLEYQDARVREVIAVAYQQSRHYRQLMQKAGLRSDDIKGVADLPKLPLLSKDTVRNRVEDLTTSAEPRSGWLHGHTSGTTGTPLGLWYDRQTCVMTNAVDRQHKSWAGLGDDQWLGVFLGRVVVPVENQRAPFWRVNRVHRQVWFSSFHMSDDNLALYVAELQRRRIRALEGYPSTLYILANFLARHGRTLPMTAVVCSSETLHQAQRECIEAAFGCRLSDFYGLAERCVFAGECGHGGKHLAEGYGYAEIVDENGQPVPDGKAGFLVGTSLWNTATPMIRYRTSDISAIVNEPCACGRTSRRIRDITTKAEDIVVTPDGRMISPSVLTHPFKPLKHVAVSQLIQETPDHIVVNLVPTQGYDRQEEASLVSALQARLGSEVRIDVRHVDAIPREKSGKFRWVISKVDHSCVVSW